MPVFIIRLDNGMMMTPKCRVINRFLSLSLRRQRGSVIRVGDLNAEDSGSNPRLGLLNEFVLGDPRGNFTTLYK